MARTRTGLLIAALFVAAVWGVYAVVSATDEDRVESTWRPLDAGEPETVDDQQPPEPPPPPEPDPEAARTPPELPPPPERSPQQPPAGEPEAPPEPGPQPTGTRPTPSHGATTISHGERVDLADYAVPGKTTIFDFYSDYCPPCKAISPRLEALAERRDDIAVVKVDVNRPGVRGIDWQSPVARQHDLHSIPHFIIYGPDGQMESKGPQAGSRVQAWLSR